MLTRTDKIVIRKPGSSPPIASITDETTENPKYSQKLCVFQLILYNVNVLYTGINDFHPSYPAFVNTFQPATILNRIRARRIIKATLPNRAANNVIIEHFLSIHPLY